MRCVYLAWLMSKNSNARFSVDKWAFICYGFMQQKSFRCNYVHVWKVFQVVDASSDTQVQMWHYDNAVLQLCFPRMFAPAFIVS